MMDKSTLANVTLQDKYTLPRGRVYMTGTQALVRLLLAQKQRDAAAGLNTGGFVSGYRGSPLGAVDQELWKAKQHLAEHGIKFVPGLNEELAATAVWGTQMVNLDPNAQVDGVFALWYGKGPGVDRSGDVFKHGNIAGCSRHGGVLLVAGDDHSCKSSSLPHQSEHAFIAAMIPVLNPSGVREFIEFGLHGWAMSRYSGCWVGFKSISDTIESSSSFEIDPMAVEIKVPDTYPIPGDGFHIRWPDPPLEQENRLQRERLYALLEYVRLNRLNRQDWAAPDAKLGIVTTGKSYLDVREALAMMGINEGSAQALGIRLLKIGVSWPLEPECIREFADGLDEILVVEEKRQIIEYQLKEQLYNAPIASRPRVVGKYDETGEWVKVPHDGVLLSPNGELTPAAIAGVIAARMAKVLGDGTYMHSGSLAIRAAKAAGVNITYKILVNDAVAMTGGQPVEGSPTVPQILQQLAAEGVEHLHLVSDEPELYQRMSGLPAGVAVSHRDGREAPHRRRPPGARGGGEPVQAHGLQGRVRGGAAVCRDRLLRPRGEPVRGRLQAALPSGAAAVLEEGRPGPPGQAVLRAVDRHRLQVAGQGQAAARHAAGPLRLQSLGGRTRSRTIEGPTRALTRWPPATAPTHPTSSCCCQPRCRTGCPRGTWRTSSATRSMRWT
jgi:TPP-dependent indolepyruvate ferredoxin oxidoreductase alpha subunit